MYEALDEFTNVKTWTSHHWLDDERFYRALGRIVENHGFDPQRVGRYLEEKYIERFGNSDEAAAEAKKLANLYAERAYTISKYLQAIR